MRLLRAMDASSPEVRPPLLARLGLTDRAVDSRHLVFEAARFGKKQRGTRKTCRRWATPDGNGHILDGRGQGLSSPGT